MLCYIMLCHITYIFIHTCIYMYVYIYIYVYNMLYCILCPDWISMGKLTHPLDPKDATFRASELRPSLADPVDRAAELSEL